MTANPLNSPGFSFFSVFYLPPHSSLSNLLPPWLPAADDEDLLTAEIIGRTEN